ncbi:MAG: ATP-dependent Clp protease ATP-binding subunit, partial [Clostridia bacterium]|nr:ATP-dependent Clp protease ATP-binding subunit [Clostridia bacterium]
EKAEKKVAALVGSGDPTNLSARDMTPRARRIIEQSFAAAKRYGQSQVGTEHLLSALLCQRQSTAAAVIAKMGVDPATLNDMVTERLCMNDLGFERGAKTPKMLQKYGVDLTALAAMGELDPLVGRQEELERLMVLLCRRTKNNPCLIGQPGVGKTVLVEGLAQAIVRGEVPEGLQGKQVWQLELTSMVAGSKYRGEFEERIRGVVEECEKHREILLFIDEVHTIMGAGAAEGAVDAANILKPALSRGKIRLIGATTLAEYRRHIEKDSALERRFAPLRLEEPTSAQTEEILRRLRPRLEEHHGLCIRDDAIKAAVDMSVRYLCDRYLPDKAIDLLDEACSAVSIRRKRGDSGALEQAIVDGKMQEYLSESLSTSDLWVEVGDVATVVSRATGIPAGAVEQSEQRRLTQLEKAMEERVIGQKDAVAAVANAIRCARLGLGDPRRPVGSFLFAGPTGVGKTELCKALARALFDSEKALIRLDMSEYMEKHSLSRLIGAPPGYVGYEGGGTLVESVRNRPYSVVVFDEVEKAHPDVCNLLLQILEEGCLTESGGKKADFTHSVVILTTNLGAGT